MGGCYPDYSWLGASVRQSSLLCRQSVFETFWNPLLWAHDVIRMYMFGPLPALQPSTSGLQQRSCRSTHASELDCCTEHCILAEMFGVPVTFFPCRLLVLSPTRGYHTPLELGMAQWQRLLHIIAWTILSPSLAFNPKASYGVLSAEIRRWKFAAFLAPLVPRKRYCGFGRVQNSCSRQQWPTAALPQRER